MSGGVTCDRCGIARPRDLRRVGIAFERRLSVEREFCPSCSELVLAAIHAALSGKAGERFTIESDGRFEIADRGVPHVELRRRKP